MARDSPRAVRFGRRILLTIAVVAACVYGAALLFLVSQETRIVFEAPPALGPLRPAPPFEQVDLPRPDGERQFAWIMRHARPGAPWVLYLHGNDATVARRVNILRFEHLRALGLNVLAPEYRGFAGLPGRPTEESVTADARHAYDYLRDVVGTAPSQLIVFGWSLGSAVAVNLVAEVDAAAVILEGAPASLVAIGERRYPLVPIRRVMRNPFESILKVHRIKAPMLFLHSPEDGIIPIEEGRRLFDAARVPKRFVELRGGHIRPAEADADVYVGAMREFLREHRLLAR